MAGFLTVGLAEAKDIFSDKEVVQQSYTPSFNTAFWELTKVYKDQI